MRSICSAWSSCLHFRSSRTREEAAAGVAVVDRMAAAKATPAPVIRAAAMQTARRERIQLEQLALHATNTAALSEARRHAQTFNVVTLVRQPAEHRVVAQVMLSIT